MATIVILEHQMQRGFNQPYMVYLLAEHWTARGHKVLRHFGTDTPPAADIAIANIDLTVIPDAYVALYSRYPRVINAAVVDISKRAYSTQQIVRGDPWPGPVIVKTNANFGGRIDARLRRRALAAGVTPDIPPQVTMTDYAVLQSIDAVPADVWSNDALIVEKFLPEQDPDGYYMRVWVFLGERERSMRMRAQVPVIKSHHITNREYVEVPAAIRAWRQRLGFDYGKFDYVVRDGEAILIDANRTPGAPSGHATDPSIAAGMKMLSEGLDTFL